MHPPDCPSWEYANHPRRASLTARASEVINSLRDGSTDLISVAADSRGVHRHLFRELTPQDCEYFAGHYRGERFRCLRYYRVKVGGDPRVGVPPAGVAFSIGELSNEIRAGLAALDSNILLSTVERLRYVVALASHAFVAFLTVHPYANGNGHAARLIVWSIFGRYGYWPDRWPVEPRPPDPEYLDLIVRHRDGEAEPLESYFLQMLA